MQIELNAAAATLPSGEPISALIDFGAGPAPLRRAFGRPLAILAASTPDEVVPLLDAVHRHAMQGRWCVGFVQYEAAPAFDAAMAVHAARGPLAWFSVHDEAFPWPDMPGIETADGQAPLRWQSSLGRAQFDAAISRIHQAIEHGDVYQVNFTAGMHAKREPTDAHVQRLDSLRLFAALRRAQPRAYAAWIDTGEQQVVSVSPELFFHWQGEDILARPMKGTAARGATPSADAAAAKALRASAKERAENVMIVDLLRNDMSRIAQPFSVQVQRLFDVAAWPTVWQMTSDVLARTRSGTTLADVFGALFPCGSVTGAPKLSAMRIIRELEPAARGVYCGAVGLVQPGGAATFNVPIRTVTMNNDALACGIGSGVTIDAHAPGEWAEWRNKRAFLMRASAPFQILETLRLQDGNFHNLDLHLARMTGAAAHFGYGFELGHCEGRLQRLAESHAQGTWRVRLLLDPAGNLEAQAFALPPSPERVSLQLAGRPFEEADSEFVRFKTTRREHYEAFAPTDPHAFFDTLLWNERGEITECTRGNIALLIDGRWVTPAASCGLLPGIERSRLLQEGRLSEAVIRRTDLGRASAIAFINSLRGWIDAAVVDASA
ncbi:MAG: aminodeoxychorismate synthase component I [Proteobacteria bacterium]|nr:aminodeoxychorismate synthase component I [Pseudomonadota bacterium]